MREPRRLAKRIGAKVEEARASHRRAEEDVSRFVRPQSGSARFEVAVVLEVQGGREKDSATKEIKDGKRADGKERWRQVEAK